MQASKPLNRRVAVVLALVVMWLVSSIGLLIVLQLLPRLGIIGDWYFLDLHGYDIITIGQIGCFFLNWAAAQYLGACYAGLIIGSSDFKRPLRTTFLALTSYELILSIIRAFRWPWTSFHDLNQSIPILAYLMSVFSVIAVSVFSAWFRPKFHRFFFRFSTRLINRKP